MAHEILSIKLSELDEQITKLHSRIRTCESADPDCLKRLICCLEKDFAQAETNLARKVNFSKAGPVSILADARREIEKIICQAKSHLTIAVTDENTAEYSSEMQILTAEYALDFALLAVRRALLDSAQAIESQLILENTGKEFINERS